MSYKLEIFKSQGFYQEKPEMAELQTLQGGKVITSLRVSQRVLDLLASSTSGLYQGDKSRQDSAVITSLLSSGLSPEDTYATFANSTRGKDAMKRKEGHFEDYMRRTIERSVGFVTENPSINLNFALQAKKHTGTGLVVSMGHEVETEKVNWVWPGFIPAGKLTLIAGDPGMGKSTIVGDIISRITRGNLLPTGQRAITGTCLVASAEDAAEDTIIPRLIAAEANLRKTGIIREVRNAEEEGESKYLSFPRDIDLLRTTMVSTGCRLLIIDPLTAFLEKGTDSYKDQDMRRVLHPIEKIAQETGAAIVIVAHLNKKEDSSTLYRVGGSIGFIAAARSVIGVTHTEDKTRVIYSLKTNLAKRPQALAYEIKEVVKHKTEKNTWLGEDVIKSSAIRWLGEVDFDPFSPNKTKPKEVDEPEAFLREVLATGEKDTDEIYKEAKRNGLSRIQVNHARHSLNLQTRREDEKWLWRLPE